MKTYRLGDERPSEADLARLEEDLGGRLPSAYKRFLVESAPCGIEGGAVFALDDGSRGRISAFFGAGGVREAAFETYPGRVPDETVPIGENGQNGDLVLLVFDGPQRGWVATWDHERECGRGWANVRVAAHSFSDFLALLEPDPDYAR